MKTFITALQEIVQQYPDAAAIVDRGHACSYRQLWQEAQGVAAYLAANGIGREDIVGINIAKSKDYIVCLLGTWMKGAAFMPLDPSLPKERLNYIIAEAEPKHILSASPLFAGGNFSPAALSPSDLAYVFYTSGSTGKPKGVMVEHRGLMPMLETQIKAFGFAAGKKSLFYLSIAFDASVSDIGTSLLSGATLVIVDDKDLRNGDRLLRILKDEAITHFDCPPSLLRAFAPEQMPSSLETIVIGGEVCPSEVVREWVKKFRIVNVYGPTEATVCSSLCICGPDWQQPLIGDPVQGTTFNIIDGELYIAGDGLARGYLGQPELTARKFVTSEDARFYRTGDAVRQLADGKVLFLGRLDRQFKLRGQLIEPEEIESRILQCAGVKQAAVVKRPLADGARGEALVAFISPENVPAPEIRAALEKTLPQWMVPYHIEALEALPLTASGKPDFSVLKTKTLSRARGNSADDKSTATEERLIQIWRTVLGHSLFGGDDTFSAAGGDSLDVIRLTLEASRANLPLSPGLLASYPTIKRLAAALDAQITDDMSDAARLRNEAVLKDDIRALLEQERSAPSTAGDIFITGATGALGSRLLIELLDKTSAKIYCLIRAKDNAQAQARLREKIGFDDGRLLALAGDAAEKFFDFTQEQWNALSRDIGAIYHCAAKVSMVDSYADLKAANVGSVEEVIRLALTGRSKHIHYASTLSVFVATDRNTGIAREDDRLGQTRKVYGGYAQTKFVAELMLQHIPQVTQYRLGLIAGDSMTGIGPDADALSLFVKGISSLGVTPPLQPLAVDITPIDYAAAAMADLSLRKEGVDVYHVANAKSLMLTDLLAAIKRCGANLRPVSQEEWEKLPQTRSLTTAESAAWMALCRLLPEKEFNRLRSMDLFQATGITFDMKRSGFICPTPDNRLIDKYAHSILARNRQVRRVCVFGPESTGKSTLAKKLAEHFSTVHVDEFAKDLIHANNGEITAADIPRIAAGQAITEDEASLHANKLLICDTDLLTTRIWSEFLFKGCPGWIKMEAARRKYDLYLLMDIDVPWVDDVHRYAPEQRREFLETCERELKQVKAKYVKISGDWQSRFTRAIAAIEALA